MITQSNLLATIRRITPRLHLVAISHGVRSFSSTKVHPYAQITDTPFNAQTYANTMPPNYKATVGRLTTFTLPERVTGHAADRALGEEMVHTWRTDGIFQIRVPKGCGAVIQNAYKQSRSFFSRPYADKARHVDDQSFSGYIASGEELTAGAADLSEIFTVTPDIPTTDARVRARWPCHGPCPWPTTGYQSAMADIMKLFGRAGETLLQLTALGLHLSDAGALNKLTEDGWHHLRVLRFPQATTENRGIGSHTDYGLLVLATQDDVGGLFVRPPLAGEELLKNWEKSSAGINEHDEKWMYVPPVEDVLTVFPGDMMQYLTNGYLPSTPHKVGLNTRERFSFAYFHEPNFSAIVRTLPEYTTEQERPSGDKGIHYGTHFTNMFMRNYPERVTAKRMLAENRIPLLQHSTLRHEGFGTERVL